MDEAPISPEVLKSVEHLIRYLAHTYAAGGEDALMIQLPANLKTIIKIARR